MAKINKAPMVTDKRYNIGLEFCGHATQLYVVRFCGDFISPHHSCVQAEIAAIEHATARGHNHSDWVLVAKLDDVIWLRKRKDHRVAYGADVSDFEGRDASIEAAECFGHCVHHSLECSGVFNHD